LSAGLRDEHIFGLAALVLHQLDEQVHHGAELGVLRDLYRHDAAQWRTGLKELQNRENSSDT
jgi:hypothetical protein